MPIIFDGQYERTYCPPKFGTGFQHRKNGIYKGGAWRDFGNNVVIGSGKPDKANFIAQQKKEAVQQGALDRIIKNARTKEDIISGGAFKVCK
jgi:hypothetical protein